MSEGRATVMELSMILRTPSYHLVARWASRGVLGPMRGKRGHAYLYDVADARRRLVDGGYMTADGEVVNRQPREPLLVRIARHVTHRPCPVDGLLGPCWVWTGNTSKGYGQIQYRDAQNVKHSRETHRVVYELLAGDVPDGLHLDHLCRVTCCLNPFHLEPVTMVENTRRSPISRLTVNAAKTHCPKGHPYAGDNVRIFVKKDGNKARNCRACEKERSQARRDAAKARRIES